MDTPPPSSSQPNNSAATPPQSASRQTTIQGPWNDSPAPPTSLTPPSAPRLRNADTAAYRPPGAGLYEFRSLLEAAQRIANSVPFGPDGGSWLDDEQPDPIIRRSSGPDERLRRVPLTRQYSGRPHVPGEDSGSENGDGEDHSRRQGEQFSMDADQAQEYTRGTSTSAENDNTNASGFVTQNLRRMNGNRAYLEAVRARERQQESRLHSRSPPRLDDQEQDQDQETRERDSLRRAAALTRDLRRHQQRRRLRDEAAALMNDSGRDTSLANHRGHRDAITVPSYTRDPSYNRAAQSRITQETDSSRPSSVRRWRPAERLQDYASNTARRENEGEVTSPNQTGAQSNPLGLNTIVRTRPNGEVVTLGLGRVYHEPASARPERSDSRADAPVNEMGRATILGDQPNAQPNPMGENLLTSSSQISRTTTATELGDHNDIVDRVERALQEYRMARRALRATEEDSVRRPSGSQTSIAEALTSRGLVYRPPYVRPTLSGLDELDSRNTRRPPLGDGMTDTTWSPSIVNSSGTEARASAPSSDWEERWRLEDSIRDRIREQVRERRRRVVSSILEQEGNASFGSGPLFDGSRRALRLRSELNGDDERSYTDTRRHMDILRSAKTRANNKYLKQARASLEYLTRLREPDMTSTKAWKLAAELGLHNQSLHEDIKDNLAMSVDDLPKPIFSSWLEPGVCWSGMQSADDIDASDRSEHTRSEVHLRRSGEEQSDMVQSTHQQDEGLVMRGQYPRDPLERVMMGSSTSDALFRAQNSIEVLDDAERNLTSMLERSEQLLRENEQQLRRNRERLRETDERLRRLREGELNLRDLLASKDEYSKTKDDWIVKVTLHSVDWESMTVTGTMNASQKQRPVVRSVDSDDDNTTVTSMDSFFSGEIIDFTNHGLDTPSSPESQPSSAAVELFQIRRTQDQWKVGGPETDLVHWAGIGPFKQEIDREITKREAELLSLAHDHDGDRTMSEGLSASDSSLTDAMAEPTPVTTEEDREKNDALPSLDNVAAGTIRTTLTSEEKYDLKLKTMHRLLTDTTWLGEHINSQGWILMRWKERCFVSPGVGPNPEPTRPWIPSRAAPSNNSNPSLDIPTDAPYLRYAGFFRRRQHERNSQRIYTTNAAEREEISGIESGNPTLTNTDRNSQDVRIPTWGLTISGFYYVALHRRTGQIEALYYDHGSAPFQRLRMSPTISASMSQQQTSPQEKKAQEDNAGDVHTISGGLRTNFSLVEFR